jgi:hypothetical protein
MEWKKLTQGQRKINRLRLRGRQKVGKMLADDPNMTSSEAKKIVTNEIKKKHKLDKFRL